MLREAYVLYFAMCYYATVRMAPETPGVGVFILPGDQLCTCSCAYEPMVVAGEAPLEAPHGENLNLTKEILEIEGPVALPEEMDSKRGFVHMPDMLSSMAVEILSLETPEYISRKILVNLQDSLVELGRGITVSTYTWSLLYIIHKSVQVWDAYPLVRSSGRAFLHVVGTSIILAAEIVWALMMLGMLTTATLIKYKKSFYKAGAFVFGWTVYVVGALVTSVAALLVEATVRALAL
eukprot:232931_1